MNIIIKKSKNLKGEVNLPGDKSISHRAAILLSISQGCAEVKNFLFSQDCINTLKAMRIIGADIKIENGLLKIRGNNKYKINNINSFIYSGNSGTLMRLICGLLSGTKGSFLIYGDDSLNNRPMERIIKPIRMMGGDIKSIYNNGCSPIVVRGKELHGISYKMDVPSAQVKSCIMLASILAEGKTEIYELEKTRDHTERMLKYLGYNIDANNKIIKMECEGKLYSRDIIIPGDISSAAFIIGGCILAESSEIIIKNVLYNDRTGYLDVLKDMGADIEIIEVKNLNNEESADIRIKSSRLKSVNINGDIIVRLIDELPLIAVLSAFAEGTTVIKGAKELRKKESDRIKTIIYNLRQMDIEVYELEDGMIIKGCSFKNTNRKVIFNSFYDHRIAMAFSLAGIVFDEAEVIDCECINTSFPEFFKVLSSIGADIRIK